MITDKEVFKIGKLIKPHGIKGEISFAFDNDIFDRADCPYLICKIDGIYVPFFIEEYRFKGKETALITFEDIDSEEKAQRFSGLDVYFPRKYYEEDDVEIDYSWNFFIGFSVIDYTTDSTIGVIDAIDDKTINTLFLVNDGDNDHIIPATEDFIVKVDAKKKIVYMDLPEGLLE